MKPFRPNFDVKETRDTYELHGELPGIEQKDVSIEFTDSDTLTLKGKVERGGCCPSRSSATSAFSSFLSGKSALTTSSMAKDRQPTVEDENQPSASASATGKPAEEALEDKYWVTERSVGEFSRSFTFPVKLDQDRVWAEMRNGILTVVLPKAKGRKIVIN